MKAIAIIVGALLGAGSAGAQDSQKTVTSEKTPSATNVVEKTAPVAKPKVEQKAGLKKVSYGGFLVDLTNTNRLFKTEHPLAPGAPGVETNNLNLDPRTGKFQGFKLFSVKF